METHKLSQLFTQIAQVHNTIRKCTYQTWANMEYS